MEAAEEDGGVIAEQIFQIKNAAHAAGMVVPSDFLVVADGKNYLKLVGSRFWLRQFVCPEAAKSVKNISLAGTKQMTALMEAVWCVFFWLLRQKKVNQSQIFQRKQIAKGGAAKERDPASPLRLKK